MNPAIGTTFRTTQTFVYMVQKYFRYFNLFFHIIIYSYIETSPKKMNEIKTLSMLFILLLLCV